MKKNTEITNFSKDIQINSYNGIGSENASWYSHFTIFIFTKGSGTQIINGFEYPFSPGTIIALSPIDFHQCVPDAGDFHAEKISFTADIFYRKMINIYSINDFPVIAHLSEKDFESTKKLLDILMRECSYNDKCSETIQANLTEQIFIYAIRNKTNNKEYSAELYDPMLNKTLMYIYYNFKKDIKIEDIASQIHYSPGYFNKMFKKNMGISFHKYLRDLRLKFAYNLLKYGKLSVSDVCCESGFNSVQHFSALFKDYYGCLPRDVK